MFKIHLAFKNSIFVCIPSDLRAKTLTAPLAHNKSFSWHHPQSSQTPPANLSALPTTERSGDCLFTVYRGKTLLLPAYK